MYSDVRCYKSRIGPIHRFFFFAYLSHPDASNHHIFIFDKDKEKKIRLRFIVIQLLTWYQQITDSLGLGIFTKQEVK